jgi:hypothetical protein
MRTSIFLSEELWERIADYRFSERLNTRNAAVTELIVAGMNAWDAGSDLRPGERVATRVTRRHRQQPQTA